MPMLTNGYTLRYIHLDETSKLKQRSLVNNSRPLQLGRHVFNIFLYSLTNVSRILKFKILFLISGGTHRTEEIAIHCYKVDDQPRKKLRLQNRIQDRPTERQKT